MNFIKHESDACSAVEVVSDSLVINSVQDALDLMANADYQCNCRKIIISKKNVDEKFFDLKSGLAGAVLQKFVNYKVRLAIVGDFESYESKSLNDFIFESNKNKQIMFLPNVATALKELRNA